MLIMLLIRTLRTPASAILAASLFLAGCGAATQPATPAAALPASSTTRADAPSFHTFEAGKTPGFRKGAIAYDITLGPDGAMWFTDTAIEAIGRITTSGVVKEYTKGLLAGAKPFSIVAGPDGNLWFSDGADAIGRVTTSGAITEFSITSLPTGQNPAGIAVTSNGDVWTAAPGTSSLLVRLDTHGKQSVVKVPAAYELDGSLTADASGNLWMMSHSGETGVMLELGSRGNWIKHLTGMNTARLPCCPNYAPKRITIGPDGNPWFSTLYWLRPNASGNVIGTTTSSTTKLFPVNEKSMKLTAYPSGITTTAKKLWFIGDNPFQDNGGLWSMDTNGAQKAYPITYSPIEIAADGTGNLWFTAEAFGEPGRIVEVTSP
jgi:virginiamycin B lyase